MVLRIGLAVIAVSLMKVIGLTLAGGIILLWVCWRFWRDISGQAHHEAAAPDANASLKRAILQIVLADVSMSLDNVLAVAGAAREHLDVAADHGQLVVEIMPHADGQPPQPADRRSRRLLASGIAVFGFLLTWFLQEKPLRDTIADQNLGDTFAAPKDATSLEELETRLSTLARKQNRHMVYEHLMAEAGVELRLAPDDLALVLRALGIGLAIEALVAPEPLRKDLYGDFVELLVTLLRESPGEPVVTRKRRAQA